MQISTLDRENQSGVCVKMFRWYNLQLSRHYGDDGYRATSAKYLLLGIGFGFLLVAIFLCFGIAGAQIPTDYVILSAIAIVSVICLGGAFLAVITGHLKIAEHVVMLATAFTILYGIATSGGIPASPSSSAIVAIPLLAFWFYGMRVGSLLAMACIAYGVLQYMFLTTYGLNLFGLGHEVTNVANTKFSAWLIAACMVLAPTFVAYKRTESLQNLLEAERNKMTRLARIDHLTQVGNVRDFYAQIDAAMETAAGDETALFSLIYLDLNAFKPINDTYGHEAGDVVLQVVAKRLLNCVRSSDRVARLGGDEFAILLHDCGSAVDIEVLVERIRQAVRAPIRFDDLTLRVSVSIGIAHYLDDGRSREDMMQEADARMYEDKQRLISEEDRMQAHVA